MGVDPNWSLGAGNSALAMFQQGAQLGSQIRQQREQTEYRQQALDLRKQEAEQHKAEFAQGQEDRATKQQDAHRVASQQLARLFSHAQKGPEQWAQAVSAAKQLGFDTSEVPAQFDPNWAAQQQLIVEAMGKDGGEAISGIARELQDAGYSPGTPEFNTAMRGVIQNKYASDYVDDQGNTRRRSALNLPAGQGGPQPGAVEDGYRFKGGNPADPNAWEPVAQGGPAAPAGAGFP